MQMTSIQESISVTGLTLFIVGIITLRPEICLSGLIVMFTSAGITLKDLESQRIKNTFENDTNESSYSW